MTLHSNRIHKVALVGAGGNVGRHIARSLLSTGTHAVTAVTRRESTSAIPASVRVAYVDYDDQASIVSALAGHDAVIITVSFHAAQGLQERVIRAAAEAGVPWILPNEWAPDSAHEGLVRDLGDSMRALPEARRLIEELGVSRWVGLVCGLWYEWCLAEPLLYGIDSVKREAVLFDDGTKRIATSTLAGVGEAVKALLSLPVRREGEGRCLEDWSNKLAYMASFEVSQKEMLESVWRVIGEREESWTLSKISVTERWAQGVEARRDGYGAKGRWVYCRCFFGDDAGNHAKTASLVNDLLGMEKENLDEATKRAIEMQRARAR